MRTPLLPVLAALLTSSALAQTPDPVIAGLWLDPPAGEYRLDPAHASLTVRANHLGFSRYTLRLTGLDAVLQFDPADPEAMSVTAQIDPASLETDYPGTDLDFDAVLTGPGWLEAALFPSISFVSTRIELTGERRANVHGDLTLHGVTLPVVLDTVFNGGWAGLEVYDPHARIGFSATTRISRAAFGVGFGLPPEGTDFGVADGIDIIIETEFTGPALLPPATP